MRLLTRLSVRLLPRLFALKIRFFTRELSIYINKLDLEQNIGHKHSRASKTASQNTIENILGYPLGPCQGDRQTLLCKCMVFLL